MAGEQTAAILKNSSIATVLSGFMIAICALTVVVWKSIKPQAKKCIDNWPNNMTTQCTLEESMYTDDMPQLDELATQAVQLIQIGVMAVGFAVALLFLPPWCAACGKKNHQRCQENCCGFIACFSTAAGFAAGVACVVIPYVAKYMLDTEVCNVMLPMMEEAKALSEELDIAYCTPHCMAAIAAFIESLCGMGGKFMTLAGVGFITAVCAIFTFFVNCISCCVSSKENAKTRPADGF
jgi:hypothetical protein